MFFIGLGVATPANCFRLVVIYSFRFLVISKRRPPPVRIAVFLLPLTLAMPRIILKPDIHQHNIEYNGRQQNTD